MSKIDPDRAALIERIKVAANALEIPPSAVDDVIKHGTSRHRSKAVTVLLAFAGTYGISLDYLIAGDIGQMLKYASIWLKETRSAANAA